PTLGLFLTSLLPAADFGQLGWWKIVSKPSLSTWENYQEIFRNSSITHSLVTTLEIAIGGTVLPILVAAMAGYAFAWLDFPGREWIFLIVIGLLVVPLQMALIPIFSLYNHVGIFDTVLSLILFHTAFGLPFATFLLRNFFVGIPKDILESARIDGASEIRIFLRLILPLGLPAIASLAIFQFLWTWNDLIVALTFAQNVQPIPVAIFSHQRQMRSESVGHCLPTSFPGLAVRASVRRVSPLPLLQSLCDRYHPTVAEFLEHVDELRLRTGWEQRLVPARIERVGAVTGGFELDGHGTFAHVLLAPGHP